jgi:hypothetical protein
MCRPRGRRPPEHLRNYVRATALRFSRYCHRGNFGAICESRPIARPRVNCGPASLSYCDDRCILQRLHLPLTRIAGDLTQ